MFLSCSWLDKWDVLMLPLHALPAWVLSGSRYETNMWLFLWKWVRNGGLGRKTTLNLCTVCYPEAQRKSQDLNNSWVFWVKTNFKMQMQSLWSRAGMRGKQWLTVYLLLRWAGTVFSTSTHQKSYCTSFLLLLCRCFKESLSAPHVIPCGVEKPLPANCSILSTLLNCFWCWHQTVLLSNLVFHSMFVTLGLGKPLASASLLPMREEEANEAENLSWKHREELLPASIVGWREGAVSTSHGGEKLGALLKLFLKSEEKRYEPRSVLLSPC